MKVIIFSDTHLAKSFDQKTFDYLKKIILTADKVIINGDFWDEHLISFEEFLDSRWAPLFPLLKSKRTVYVPGNHESSSESGKLYTKFADKLLKEYNFSLSGKDYHVEHGDRYIKPVRDRLSFLPVPKIVGYLHAGIVFLNYKLLGLPTFFKPNRNTKLMNLARAKLGSKPTLIFGHTHFECADVENDYYNCGFIRFGHASYIEINDDRIALIREKY